MIGPAKERLDELMGEWNPRFEHHFNSWVADEGEDHASVSSRGRLSIKPDLVNDLPDQRLLALVAHEAGHLKYRSGTAWTETATPRWAKLLYDTINIGASIGIGLLARYSVHTGQLWLDLALRLVVMCALLIVCIPPMKMLSGWLAHSLRSNPCHEEEFACDAHAAHVAGTEAAIAMLKDVRFRATALGLPLPWSRSWGMFVAGASHPSTRHRIKRLRASAKAGFIDTSQPFDWNNVQVKEF